MAPLYWLSSVLIHVNQGSERSAKLNHNSLRRIKMINTTWSKLHILHPTIPGLFLLSFLLPF